MQTPRQLLCALAIAFISMSTFANTDVQPQPLTIEGAITHVYTSVDGVQLRLHVFVPPNHSASTARSAIVFFFGGGWLQGSVEQFVPQARYLAQRGMIAGVADYRVRDRHGTSPFEAMTDAKSAIRWLRAHSAELGIDPDRIAAGGGSAGGHLALSAAVFEVFDAHEEDQSISSKPNALLLFNPVVDTTYGIAKEIFGARNKEASPLHHLGSSLPPTVIFHGKADTDIPYADAEKFCAQARNRDLPCELFGYQGAPHGFFNPGNAHGKWYRETLLEADRFLSGIGFLSPP